MNDGELKAYMVEIRKRADHHTHEGDVAEGSLSAYHYAVGTALSEMLIAWDRMVKEVE